MKASADSASWSGDVTNDGQVDYVMASGQAVAIQSCRTGNLQAIEQVTMSATGQTAQLLGVQDLNRNAIPEVVVAVSGTLVLWGVGQPHVSAGMLGADIYILEWNGTGFSRFNFFVPVMTAAELADVDGNGTVEIVATSDFQPKTDLENVLYWEAYPWRKTVRTYAWTGTGYALMQTQRGPAEYTSQLMAEARETTDYATVLQIYGQVLQSPGLKGWTPELEAYKTAMAQYYLGGQQGAAPVAPDPGLGKSVVVVDQAWADYFVILRATAEGDLDLAKLYDSQLQSQFATVEAAQPVLGLAAAFWNEYSVSQDLSQACYQARVFAVQQGWDEAASRCFYQEKRAPAVLEVPALPAVRTANQAPVTVLPSQAEAGTLPSLWDTLQITNLDLLAPGLRNFEATLPQTEPQSWPFFWCTSNNPAILQRNLDNLTVAFLINGERVPDENILRYQAENSTQQCQFWATLLRDWQPGTVRLEIVYFFRTQVFDGTSKYPAGEYRYSVNLKVP